MEIIHRKAIKFGRLRPMDAGFDKRHGYIVHLMRTKEKILFMLTRHDNPMDFTAYISDIGTCPNCFAGTLKFEAQRKLKRGTTPEGEPIYHHANSYRCRKCNAEVRIVKPHPVNVVIGGMRPRLIGDKAEKKVAFKPKKKKPSKMKRNKKRKCRK